MVRAWYLNYDTKEDQSEPQQFDPPKPVEIKELEKLGVLYYKIESEKDLGNDRLLKMIREERNYTYEDEITCSREKLPNYDEMLKMFYTEHLHADEEIRLCTDGSGYFDVRDEQDQWIRIQAFKGDMIILPAGIYHRFTLDSDNYIEAKRYFVGDPVWTPYFRPNDEHPARIKYLEWLSAA